MSNHLENNQSETSYGYDEDLSASELPSRKERHRYKRNDNKNKRVSDEESETEEIKGITARLPLVRVWLILFLLIIGLVLSYPLWSEV